MIKVGNDCLENGKYRKYSYKDVVFDKDGWADASMYLPKDYDLVHMKLKRDNVENKILPGWIFCRTWRGLNLRIQDRIIAWKIKPEEKERS